MNESDDKTRRAMENKNKVLAAKGTGCKIVFAPCCFKLEQAIAKGKLLVFFNKTIFNENNEISRPQTQDPCYKHTGSYLTETKCPFCEAPMTIEKDLSKIVTYYGVGLTDPSAAPTPTPKSEKKDQK